MPSSNNTVAKNTIWNLLGWLSLATLGFVSAPLFLHQLGSEHYGLLALLTSLVAPFGLLEFGTGEATIKYVSEALGRRDSAQAARYVNTTLTINIVVGVLGAAVIVGLSELLITRVFRVSAADHDLATKCVVAVALNWAFTRVRLTFSGVASALRDYRTIAVTGFIYQFVYVCAGLATLFLGGNLGHLVATQAAISMAGALVWYFVLRRVAPELRIKPSGDIAALRQTLGFGAWQFGNYVGDIFIQQGIRWQLGAWVSVAAIGYYNISYQLAGIVYTVAFRVGQVLLPEVSTLHGKGEEKHAGELLVQVNWAVSVIIVPIYAALFVTAPDILTAWAGHQAAAAGSAALQLFCAALAIASIFAAPSFFLLGSGRPQWMTWVSAAQATLATVTAVLLVPRLGITGAACALAASTFADIVIVVMIWRKILRDRFGLGSYLVSMFGSLVVGALCALLGWAIRSYFAVPAEGWLGVLAVALVVVPFTLTVCMVTGVVLPGSADRVPWLFGLINSGWVQVFAFLRRIAPARVATARDGGTVLTRSEPGMLGAGIDKVGSVVVRDGSVRRTINPPYHEFYRGVLSRADLMDDLFRIGLVHTVEERNAPGELVLRHELIPRSSYWREWSFDMLRDAALLTVRLTRRLHREGLCLKDAHPYNVMFRGMTPIFIDFGSVTPSTPAMQKSWARGFFVEFLLPLWALKKRRQVLAQVMHNLENIPAFKELIGTAGDFSPRWRKLFAYGSGFEAALDELERWLVGLSLDQYRTTWEDYYSRGDGLPDQHEVARFTNKEAAAAQFMDEARRRGAATLLDVASNEGWFAQLAALKGYDVVAFDYDERAINNLYRNPRIRRSAILPLVMNFMYPTAAHGSGQIWPAAAARMGSDVVLGMAIMHHLVLSQGMSFEAFAANVRSFTKRYAIIEFIGPDDVHVRRRVRRKKNYTEAAFLAALERHFRVIDSAVSEPATRRVYFLEVRDV